jgi:hypothetical protein
MNHGTIGAKLSYLYTRQTVLSYPIRISLYLFFIPATLPLLPFPSRIAGRGAHIARDFAYPGSPMGEATVISPRVPFLANEIRPIILAPNKLECHV